MSDMSKSPRVSGECQRPQTMSRETTAWGYAIKRPKAQRRTLEHAELALIVVGSLFIAMATSFWLLPGSLSSSEVIGFKLVLTIVFGSVGVSMMQLARRGLQRELQVDRRRRQLRVVWRNRDDEVRLQTVVGFGEVASLTLSPTRFHGHALTLGARLVDVRKPINLFRGHEDEMQSLRLKIENDLRTPMGTSSVYGVVHSDLNSFGPMQPQLAHRPSL